MSQPCFRGIPKLNGDQNTEGKDPGDYSLVDSVFLQSLVVIFPRLGLGRTCLFLQSPPVRNLQGRERFLFIRRSLFSSFLDPVRGRRLGFSLWKVERNEVENSLGGELVKATVLLLDLKTKDFGLGGLPAHVD